MTEQLSRLFVKLYLATPIAQFKNDLGAAQAHAQRFEDYLTSVGYDVVNPLKCPPKCEGKCRGPVERKGDLHARTCYLKWDIIEMLQCDAVALAPGWFNSAGANEEKRIAEHCGMVVHEVDVWLKSADWAGKVDWEKWL
jgi:hypothetical protein